MRHTTAPRSEDRVEAALLGAPPPALRLLVTNPWNGQAYCVLRALRPHATRVIATSYREHGLLGRLAPAAVSRFVDGVYQVPFATHDWQRGRIRDENSESEEAYVQAILDICAREAIDTVFPSWDPEVGILSGTATLTSRRAGSSTGTSRLSLTIPWRASPGTRHT